MLLGIKRLRLRPRRDTDREGCAALNAGSMVMEDLGEPLERRESDSKFERYVMVSQRVP